MKKLILFALMFGMVASVSGATISTNILVGKGTYLLKVGRADVDSIQLTSTNAYLARFYDQSTLAAPYYGTNYVTAEYSGRSTYATNYVTTWTNSTGVINYATNSGVWTVTTTVEAATNGLPAIVEANTVANAVSIYDVDAIFTKGIVAVVDGNVNITVTYK